MTLTRLHKFSLTFYLVILGLTIPIYLFLYGASGHEFNIPADEQLWLLLAGAGFVLGTIYKRKKERKGLTYIGLQFLFGAILVGAFYGGLKLFLFIVKFDFGADIGFITIGLSYIVPLVFILSCGLIFLGLFKKVE
jgi:hypothetical protein